MYMVIKWEQDEGRRSAAIKPDLKSSESFHAIHGFFSFMVSLT
jgi:hypothetical protein